MYFIVEFKKVLTIISGLAFIAFSGSMMLRLMLNPQTPPTVTENTEQTPELERLKQAEKGYQSVLEKEPNNRFALENLVTIKLQLGNLQEAQILMKKLVEIDPQNERYQEVLGKINQGIEEQKNLVNSPDNNNFQNNPNPNNTETNNNP